MKKTSYEQVYDSDWLDASAPFDLACCHCHLTHEIRTRIRDGKVQMRFIPLAGATAALRRHHRVKLK